MVTNHGPVLCHGAWPPRPSRPSGWNAASFLALQAAAPPHTSQLVFDNYIGTGQSGGRGIDGEPLSGLDR